MMAMLRRLRLGDGQLARFNGMGATERDALAMVLAYDSAAGKPPIDLWPSSGCPRSGYARLQRGATVVVVDAGTAPPLDLAGEACAGCLSFELSTGAELLLVNGGTPAMAHERATAAARATASHNTLVLGRPILLQAGAQRRSSAPDRSGADPAARARHLRGRRDRRRRRAARLARRLCHPLRADARPHAAALGGRRCLDGEDTLEAPRASCAWPRTCRWRCISTCRRTPAPATAPSKAPPS